MQNNFTSTTEDEIQLSEVILSLWSHKLIIACSVIFGIFLSICYILNTDKEFTSSAIFKLPTKSSNDFALPGSVSGLAKMTGLGANFPGTSLPYDEVMGREFIEELNESVDFSGDSFFNNYNPNHKDPAWKVFAKNLIGWQQEINNVNEIIWQKITKKYKNSVDLKFTTDNALSVSVSHTNPFRSSEITNAIMLKIINDEKGRNKSNQDKQLEYLSQSLTDSLVYAEESLSKLKNFSVESSTLPAERFAVKTQKLDTLRVQLYRTSEIHDALEALSEVIELGPTEEVDYFNLRKKHPIVDQVEFRRVLGQNEIISSWNWPDKTIVDAVHKTLTERSRRLKAEVKIAQKEAVDAAKIVEEYVSLKREATNAEATHTVLIEQVKAQTMLAGYMPEQSKIFEYASAPLNASYPKPSNILPIGAAFGMFLGCILSFILASYRGVFYTQKNLISEAHARLNVKAKTLMLLRNIELIKITSRLQKKSLASLRNLAVEIHRNDNVQVLFTSLNSRLKSYDLAKALASYINTDNLNIALINFSTRQQESSSVSKLKTSELFLVKENISNITVLYPNNKFGTLEVIAQRDFQDQLLLLQSRFDLIFLSAENDDAISLASALNTQDTTHFVIARIKHTKSKALAKLRTLIPIQGFIYE
jgi:uncharacterized protein involved in exopolysaccharide biosynthesis